MSAAIGADEDLRQRFHREAQSAARLNHPNIITVYDFGEEQGKIYMAMELLEGTDLKDLIGRHTPMSLEQKVGLMEQISDGLAFAHAKEVVHRDLKPANLHIQPNGQIKIMDFGLAKLSSSDMTRAGMIMGTPNYMSPEQVRGEKADSRSDVFSLGAVFYELLANRKPFDADSLHAVLFQVMQSEPEPLPHLVPDLPPSLAHLIEKAMSKDPAQRFRDAGELRDALRGVRSQLHPAWTMPPTDTESLLDATVVGTPATIAVLNQPPPAPAPPTEGRKPSDSSPPAPRPRVIVHPPTPIPRAPSPPPSQVEGAVALEPQTRKMPDTVAPRMPSTLSGHAKTVAGPGRAPAEPPVRTPPPPPPPPSSPLIDSRPPAPAPEMRAETAPRPPRPTGEGGPAWKVPVLVGGGALLVALMTGGIYLLTRPDDKGTGGTTETPSPGPPGPDVDALTRQLLDSQVELAKKHLDDKNFRRAREGAEKVLQKDGQHAGAKAILEQADRSLREVEENVRQVKAALDAGDTGAASAALSRVMALDPQNPAAAEYSSRLNSVFQGKADAARNDMKKQQQDALRAKAGNQPDFGAAGTLSGDAEAAFKKGEFLVATRKFMEARDAYARARRAAERAERVTPPPTVAATLAPVTPPPTPVVTAPPPVSLAPTPVPVPTDEATVRSVVASYKRAVETHDDGLYGTLKPDASANEKRSIKQNPALSVEMRVADVRIEGNTATVMVSRKDSTRDGQVLQLQQTLILQKRGDGWIIRSITSQLIR